MQSAFGTVLWIVCGLGIVVAFVSLASTGKTWEEYGKNRLVWDTELGHAPTTGSAAALVERDAEIRPEYGGESGVVTVTDCPGSPRSTPSPSVDAARLERSRWRGGRRAAG